MNAQGSPAFVIEKLYLRAISIDVPNAPQIYLEREAHKLRVELDTQSTELGEAEFEVVLKVKVVARIGDSTAFVIEAAQAGIFRVQHLAGAELEALLRIGCPSILFPYARQAVADSVGRAGFPPVLLQPVNFAALHESHRATEVAEAL